ncbi:MAG TPA: glutamine--fructose-6-phosphate transaminase (isomerizing) [Candidatus Brocadiia bacterium]|nr:glutamine--fructose-6-phosphate transaminase (isomerizing) [Candidatus Brocadiia bacterium]
MCGIFGYVGGRASGSMLLESLRRLEYRGYDSWGVALGGEGLCVRRKAGRIPLAGAALFDPPLGPGPWWGGIAHTRWATHGAPTAANAHPHVDCSGQMAVVHNGIIENYAALRVELESQGHRFRSETDTEVIAHLIEEVLKTEPDFHAAFLGALRLLEGTFGVAVIRADRPGLILAARRGSPVVLGVGEREMMVASDPAALVAHTRQVVYLEDGEAAALCAEGFETLNLDAAPILKPVQRIAYDLPAIERGGYAHFMLKEIHEQPETLRNALRGRVDMENGMARLGGVDANVLRQTRRCHLLGCGTSWHAALVGKYLLENLARLPAEAHYAAEFRYANPCVEPGDLAIAISQSGETADTLAGLQEAMARGAAGLGVCNVVGSSIARACKQGVYIHAGPEIGVASTKAFTGQLVALALLSINTGRLRGLSQAEGERYLAELERLPGHAQKLLDAEPQIKEIAEAFHACPNFLYVGRLYEYPVALEGALKLKEISYIHAEGIPAAELKHGPIALVDPDMPTVVLAAQSGVLAKMRGNVQEIRARGGRIIAVAREGDTETPKLAEQTIFIPPTLDSLVPILAVIPLQLLAYHIAVRRGCDVDRPRNLAKSVTVE